MPVPPDELIYGNSEPPEEEMWRYWLSPRMPVVYWGSIPWMWMSYVVLPR